MTILLIHPYPPFASALLRHAPPGCVIRQALPEQLAAYLPTSDRVIISAGYLEALEALPAEQVKAVPGGVVVVTWQQTTAEALRAYRAGVTDYQVMDHRPEVLSELVNQRERNPKG